ncbi:MAG: SgcJ/EcaC family oxidoreductase [Acidobacteriaceae bacterium]
MLRSLFMIAFCSAALFVTGFPQALSSKSGGEQAAVRQLFTAQTAAWNRGDLDAFMQGYWHSPELTFYGNNSVTKGWQQTLDRYRERYQTGGREMGTLDFKDFSVKMLGKDYALAHGRWHLVFKNGKEATGMTTLIVQHRPEGWRIIHDHSSGE